MNDNEMTRLLAEKVMGWDKLHGNDLTRWKFSVR